MPQERRTRALLVLTILLGRPPCSASVTRPRAFAGAPCMSEHAERHRRDILQHFDQKLILAPLTRGGTLPFRRLCAVCAGIVLRMYALMLNAVTTSISFGLKYFSFRTSAAKSHFRRWQRRRSSCSTPTKAGGSGRDCIALPTKSALGSKLPPRESARASSPGSSQPNVALISLVPFRILFCSHSPMLAKVLHSGNDGASFVCIRVPSRSPLPPFSACHPFPAHLIGRPQLRLPYA
jgi:hypothetical protein